MLWGEDGDGRTRWPWLECAAARAGHLISKSALLKIPRIDFNAGAGMFSAVAFIEWVNLPQTNHHGEITSPCMLGCSRAEREKNSPSKPNELLSLRFSLYVWA